MYRIPSHQILQPGAAAVIATLLLAGCFDIATPAFYLCSDARDECPSGQVCHLGKCVPADTPRDRGPADAAQDAVGDLSPLYPTHCKASADTWVTIPAGTFIMGSPLTEPCRDTNETQHKVTLTRSFQMQATEVTRAQWTKRMGFDISFHKGCAMDCPVEQVGWHGAAAYCNDLSREQGYAECYVNSGSGKACVFRYENNTCAANEGCMAPYKQAGTCVSYDTAAKYSGQKIYECPGYRLPTEAEWEYASRAGTDTAMYSGPITNCAYKSDPNAEPISWYRYNSSAPLFDSGVSAFQPQRVAQKKPNQFCLYDMSGNVWEWVNDWYTGVDLGTTIAADPVGPSSGTFRAQRGGSFYDEPKWMRSGERLGWPHWRTASRIGFRCVRTVQKKTK